MTELFFEIVGWAVRCGARRIDQLDQPWEGETDEWKVRFNATGAEVDGIPNGAVLVEHKDLLAICVVDPSGGAVTGATEDQLIAHFRAANPEGAEA